MAFGTAGDEDTADILTKKVLSANSIEFVKHSSGRRAERSRDIVGQCLKRISLKFSQGFDFNHNRLGARTRLDSAVSNSLLQCSAFLNRVQQPRPEPSHCQPLADDERHKFSHLTLDYDTINDLQ